jgi:signal transduction histidine kinase
MKVLTEYINELDDLLNSISGRMEQNLEKKFDELISEFRSIIADSSNGSHTVKEIVQNLKNFSRIDQAEWKDASLVLGIESSLKILKHQIPDQIKIITNFKDDPTLYCNPGQLNQVFVNLISNAIQAIEGEGEIMISTEKEKDKLKVVIQDTGKGIAEEIVPKIFDPFFTTKDVDKGTGLGLSISYSILKKHNAEIDIDSKPGKGTRFSLRFPLNHED